MIAYLIDTDVLIEAKDRYYAFEFCPAFWEWLIEQNRQRKVASVKEEAEELLAGTDKLADWASERDDNFFLEPGVEAVQSMNTVVEWANMKKEEGMKGVPEFLSGADCWLVAQARALNCIVATHELFDEYNNWAKIPNACIDLGVQYMDTFMMLKQEKPQFILGSSYDDI